MPSQTLDWPAIYCDECRRVRPMRCDFMPKEGPLVNLNDAMDLMCEDGHIVATLHDRKQPPAGETDRRKESHDAY